MTSPVEFARWYEEARHDVAKVLARGHQVRDLTTIELFDGFLLVAAVDSDGGIGPKQYDTVKVSGYECGRFGTRVPLMEVLACGAIPVAAFDALAVEMKPLGEEIIAGVQDELRSIGLPTDFPLSGSTEDNVPTKQTGMGVVILGIVRREEFRPGTSKPKDEVICIGKPKSGPADAVRLDDGEIADPQSVTECSRTAGIHDILPVGSKGILHEAKELARTAGLKFLPEQRCSLDLTKSAGPSTCFIASGSSGAGESARRTIRRPIEVIGYLDRE